MLESFLAELNDLLAKYGYRIESEADAADDTGLSSEVIITEAIPNRVWSRKTVWSGEELGK